MDANRFDIATRTLTYGGTRRDTVIALAILAGIGLVSGDQADARKKKKK